VLDWLRENAMADHEACVGKQRSLVEEFANLFSIATSLRVRLQDLVKEI
jgi:hypothetical protein